MSSKKQFYLSTKQIFYQSVQGGFFLASISFVHKSINLKYIPFVLLESGRRQWAEYFHQHDILFVFWSAKAASAAMEGKPFLVQFKEEITPEQPIQEDLNTKIYGREELLVRLQSEAEVITARKSRNNDNRGGKHLETSNVNPIAKQVVVGFVGYPNVGKSSTINALVGQKRTGVTSTPGKTKHFQTIVISDELILCDCPGLVFPSFSSSRYEMIASGVLPIDRMTEHREAVQVVANRVPRKVIESIYNITLPRPKSFEPQSRPPLSSELLRSYCSSRSYISSSGLPDETKAARIILKDYVDGKLSHYEMPPRDKDAEVDEEDEIVNSIYSSDDEPNAYDPHGHCTNVEADAKEHSLSNLLDDLKSFELAGALASKNAPVAKMKAAASSHKSHKKPQRKKDRSWKVGNDDGDGMPVIKVFQKPAVNWASIAASNRQ